MLSLKNFFKHCSKRLFLYPLLTFAGAVIGGFLHEKFYRHSELVLACGLWLASVATVAVPFVGQLALLATMFALSGVADGIINSGRCQAQLCKVDGVTQDAHIRISEDFELLMPDCVGLPIIYKHCYPNITNPNVSHLISHINNFVTFLGIDGFPLYCWCQCGILDHYKMWPDVSCHDILVVCAREMLEAPPGTRVSNRPLCTRISVS